MNRRSRIITCINQRLQQLLPNYCLMCQVKTDSALALCQTCINELPWHIDHPQCRICAVSLPDHGLCGNCLTERPIFQHVISPLRYTYPIDQFITRMKFGKKPLYAHLLGHLMAEQIQHAPHYQMPHVIIPIPLHYHRLRERGFNQAGEVANMLKKILKIPVDHYALTRVKCTSAQTQLSAKERLDNMENAFSIIKPMPYTHVTLLDDVMTTGATLHQASKTLKNHGVQHINIWCVARAT